MRAACEHVGADHIQPLGIELQLPVGRMVRHISAQGIIRQCAPDKVGQLFVEGHETPEGDALLEAVCQEINGKAQPYVHRWKPTDMLIWDNWRLLHAVSGFDRKLHRRMHRTTIKCDYGLGRFENGGTGGAALEMTF